MVTGVRVSCPCRTGRAVVVGLVLVVVAGGAAFAATGYSVNVSAPRQVARGAGFDVKLAGQAPHRSIVNVWLDPRSCAKTAQREGQRPQYQQGDSYFVDQAGGGARVTYSSTVHHGAFAYKLRAHAGTHLGQQHICAYVNELGAGTNNSRASDAASYTITK